MIAFSCYPQRETIWAPPEQLGMIYSNLVIERRTFIGSVAGGLFTVALAASAQKPAIPRGWISLQRVRRSAS